MDCVECVECVECEGSRGAGCDVSGVDISTPAAADGRVTEDDWQQQHLLTPTRQSAAVTVGISSGPLSTFHHLVLPNLPLSIHHPSSLASGLERSFQPTSHRACLSRDLSTSLPLLSCLSPSPLMRYCVWSLCVWLIVCAVCPCEAGVQFNLTKSVRSSLSSPLPADVLSASPSSSELLFVSYLRQYGKVYTAVDFQRRYSVFKDNIALIDAHNADQPSSHRLGITEHADWTESEFRRYRLGYRRPSKARWADVSCDAAIYSAATPVASLDWRASSAVSGVKNQGVTQSTYSDGTLSPPQPSHTAVPLNLLSLLWGVDRSMWRVLVVCRDWQCGGSVGHCEQSAAVVE